MRFPVVFSVPPGKFRYNKTYHDGFLPLPFQFIIIALMMEAARTSETSVNFYQTARRNNPEDSNLQFRTGYLSDTQ
jgi:hypothetical protein